MKVPKICTLKIVVLMLVAVSCQSQTTSRSPDKIVGGPCEGCEAIHDFGNKKLHSIDTLPDFKESAHKLRVTGVVYQRDGKTVAENVLLYIYHTNRDGLYVKKGGEEGWANRHGYLRGWVKTGADGKYEFYTFRPAAYPGGIETEHIHLTVKEPDKNEYYLDEYIFDDDPLLTATERAVLENRGGSGIVKPFLQNGILTIERDLILGLNIPNYD